MNTQKTEQKRSGYLLHLLLCVVILVLLLDLLFLLIPDMDSSTSENRSLQKFPAVTLNALKEGTFEEKLESYIADQFPLRNQWIYLENGISRIMGKRESNGIFLADDGYLIQNFTECSEDNYKRLVEGIRSIARIDKKIRNRVLVAPTAVSVCADKLPEGAFTGDEDAFIDRLKTDLKADGIKFVDVRSSLEKAYEEGEQLYYRTDHHWTTPAAYQAYKKYAKAAKLRSNVTYTKKTVTDSFKGTLSASSGFNPGTSDEIDIYEPDKATDHIVRYVNDGETRPSVYFTENLEKRDQYTLFFNGNYPQIEIDTASRSGKVLLVLKDSYANCFVPFLIPDYSRIIMVDPRYYTDDIRTLIGSEEITDILFLYNADSLASDTNIAQMTE